MVQISEVRAWHGSMCVALLALALGIPPAVVAGQAKVEICHVPPGNPQNPQTIIVDENAVDAHLEHGDSLGPCSQDNDHSCEGSAEECFGSNSTPVTFYDAYGERRTTLDQIPIYEQGVLFGLIASLDKIEGQFPNSLELEDLKETYGVQVAFECGVASIPGEVQAGCWDGDTLCYASFNLSDGAQIGCVKCEGSCTD